MMDLVMLDSLIKPIETSLTWRISEYFENCVFIMLRNHQKVKHLTRYLRNTLFYDTYSPVSGFEYLEKVALMFTINQLT